MESVVYNQKGESVGKVALPEVIFSAPWNADMVHQVVTSMLLSRRNNVAHAKNRGEVSGGGKKPWRQKGTGRARHGSIRSPIWVGGGTTHGPRNDKNFNRKVNKTAAIRALASVLSKKMKEGEILMMKEIKLNEAKTKEASLVMKALGAVKGYDALGKKSKNALCLALPKKDAALERSFRNIGNVEVLEARNLNVTDVLSKKFVMFVNPEETFKILENRAK